MGLEIKGRQQAKFKKIKEQSLGLCVAAGD